MRKIGSKDPANRSWNPNHSVHGVLADAVSTPFSDVCPELGLDEVVFEDTRQMDGKHELKHESFALHSIPLVTRELKFGDYASDHTHYVVDTKRNISELADCVTSRWWRFKEECRKASEAGYALIILTETDEVTKTDELINWKNPVCYSMCPWYQSAMCDPDDKSAVCHCYDLKKNTHPVDGKRLVDAIHYAESQFNVYFFYCKPDAAAGVIYDFLFTRF